MRVPLSILCLMLAQRALTSISASELPVETFFRNFQYEQVKLSPDGSCLAALAPAKERVGLVVVNLDKLAGKSVYADRYADVHWFRWVNTNRLVFSFNKDGFLLGGLIAVNRDGTKVRTLVDPLDYRTSFFSTIPGSTDEILVTSTTYSTRDAQTGWRFPNVERMNLFDGSMQRVVSNPGRVVSWLADHRAVVRVGVAVEGTQLKVIYRPDASAKWETLAEFKYNEDGIEPLGFEYDNQTLIVGHCGEQPTLGLYRYDVAARKIKELGFRHPEADVQHVLYCSQEHALAGVTYVTERPDVFWLSPLHKRLQASVDKALPQTLNVEVSRSADDQKMIFAAQSDRAPGTFYLLNNATLKLEKLFDTAEWISPQEMAEMKPIQYKARDGLLIHGYLTLPPGSTGKALPLIVNPHGGPIARDVWGFDPEVQFFANRGYAVLRMNFRGSSGYGRAFLEAGYRQWGLKQQDDITDGVKWAIEQGIADPKRICIYGASYGGYAALIGLEQTPELYRCGICYAGVTDIARTFKFSDYALEVLRAEIAEEVGDPKKEKARLEQISPLNHVDKIQAPVLLAYGKLDQKVPVWTGRDLASALKKRGKLYAYIEKDDEGHGFFKEKNKIELWKKIDDFLKENLK